MKDTAMAAAFRKAGYNQRDAEMLCALAKFFNQGGTVDHLSKLVADATRDAGKGLDPHARQGQMKAALSRQSNGDAAGHGGVARKGQKEGARPSPAGQGQRSVAGKAIVETPAPRPMSPARRDARERVSQQRVRTFWDTEVGGVKRRLGSLTRFDIVQIKRRSMIDNHIADRLLTEIEWPDNDSTPLERIGQENHVKAIIESAASALEAFNA
jgi:hypothetical protein